MDVISIAERRAAMSANVIIPDTSHETIQAVAMQALGIVAFAEGQWWRFGELGAWVPMSSSAIWREVRALNGVETLEGANGKDPGKCIRVTAGMCESVEALARSRFDDVGFFASSARGFISPAGLWTCSASGWTCRAPLPDDRVRMFVDMNPDFDADPPKWGAVLHRLWSHETDYHERFLFAHEFLGAVLCGVTTRHQVSPILVGDGENGKSIVVDVFSACVPPVLRCSVTPEDLENNQFASSRLVGKALNAVPELPAGELMSSHRIKAIIDGSEQTAERKHKDGALFRPFAGHIFAANALPRVRDLSHGFWRRWVPMTCTSPRLTDAERKLDFAAEIIASELPAIIGHAMRCYEAMVRRGGRYTVVPSAAVALREWRGESDSVQAWLDEECEPGGPSTVRGLYEHYCSHARSNGSMPVGSKRFAQRLTVLGYPDVPSRTSRMRGVAVRIGP